MNDNLWGLVEPSLKKFSDLPAWIRRGEVEHTTYQQLYLAILTTAAQLRNQGVASGDTVGITAPNGPEFCVAALATWKIGGNIAPIHKGNSKGDIDTQISAVKPKIMLIHDSPTDFENCLEISMQADDDAVTQENQIPTPDSSGQVAVRIYTSGSTGNPKIVQLSHSNLASNVMATCHFQHFDHKDRFISLLPLSHAMGLTSNLLLPLYCGACIITPKVIAASEIIATLNEEGISVLIAVPRLFRNIMRGLETKFQQSSALLRGYIWLIRNVPLPLRKIINAPIRKKLGGNINCWVSGGSHLDGQISRYFHRLGIPLRQGYGLTETSPVAALQKEFDDAVDSVGHPIENVSAKILNPDSSGSGEILLKGPNVMMGYESEQQNAEVFEGEWFKTGDIGRIDDQGRITLTGRIKRLIVTEAGKNVYPEELETLLERDSRIKEAGVFELNMKPVCIVSTDIENPEKAIKETLRDYNQNVSSHNQITRFAITDELPRTALGKLALQKLPDIFATSEVVSS